MDRLASAGNVHNATPLDVVNCSALAAPDSVTMNRCGMRYISWIEAILFVALVAMSAAVVSISRKVTETIREKTKPEAADRKSVV